MHHAKRLAFFACHTLLFTALASAQAAQPVASFATSFEAGQPQAMIANGQPGFSATLGSGPDKHDAWSAKPEAGFTGMHSLHYQGNAEGAQQQVLFKLDLPVRADTQLSYLLFPVQTPDDLNDPATYVAIDLIFSDGSHLSASTAQTQYRIGTSAQALGKSRTIYVNQWNRIAIALGQFAGKRIKQVVLSHDGPGGKFEGFLDDVRIDAAPLAKHQHPSDYINTLRGTDSSGAFSRGNNIPAVTVPHGFNFWTPVTRSDSDWMYQYQQRNDDQNRPRIEAFALSHEPSPWMGDRQTLQIMPAMAAGVPDADRNTRALSFSHDHEVAHAHDYKVTFNDGIVTEIAPTDHAAILRFSFPGKQGQLIFDNRSDEGKVTIDQASHSFSGYTDVKSDLSTGATRMYFYGSFDQPITATGPAQNNPRTSVNAYVAFDTSKAHSVNLRMATSLISLDQAKHNLALELTPDESLEQVRDTAQAAWDKQLSMVQVQGASPDELTTLYSNIYRFSMYPNEAYENTGTAQQPVYQYASPFSDPVGPNTDTHTGARVLNGKPYVNNGFWDTYRTAWPMYTLLMPQLAGEMIDGFVQEYRDAGWISRWSSPGYADLMVGTSADVAFSDAWLKGIHNFDVKSFYQAALKDAMVVSPLDGTGRKGLQRSIFNGYTDNGVDEGLSWSMDGYINDFGIGNLAAALAKAPPAGDSYDYATDAKYFLNRALDYVNLFNPDIGFFVGRNAKGEWAYTKDTFNPKRWGGDYTETDGWNMAFHAPQDGAGLAALYGGRNALAAKLDAFFGAQRDFDHGSYRGVIHEMREAQSVRMGQYGHSNQPSHHIIYMYDYAGQPWKVQDKVRDVLSRLYIGSDIGQGYTGDEDNGEMSAWWLFSAAGFYPLRMGTPEYVIGAPYFPHMDIALQSGKHIVINAPGVSDTNRYVQSLTVNGQPWDKLSLPHALLAQGATLDFVMGPNPSQWGTGEQASPASLTTQGKPAPLRDVLNGNVATQAEPSQTGLQALTDHDSSTEITFAHNNVSLRWQLPQAQTVAMYTLSSGASLPAPASWSVQASSDGKHWQTLDTRKGEHFAWARQTRVFAITKPGSYTHYRLQLSDSDHHALAEIALLGQ